MFGDQVKVNAEISFDIVFDQRTAIVAEWSVIRTLLDMADRSRDCVAASKELLSIDFSL
jgi:hypothetical protein